MKKQCKSENKEMKVACGENSAFPGRAWAGCLLPSAFSSAFTLLEILIATALFGLVVAGVFSVYIMCNKIWHSTSISMQAARESSLALSRLVYGSEANSGLRAASMILLTTNFPDGSWRMTVSNLFEGIKYVDYNRTQKRIYWPNTNSIICQDVASATVITSASGIVNMQLTVTKSDGMFTASNTVSTSIKMRN